MGISLNIPQSIKSLTRSSYIWTNMIFDIPFIAAWKQIGEYRLHQTDRSIKRENSSHVDYDYNARQWQVWRLLTKVVAKFMGYDCKLLACENLKTLENCLNSRT